VEDRLTVAIREAPGTDLILGVAKAMPRRGPA